MMCALSNARSAIPACAFRSLSKRDSYAVLDKRYLRVVAGDTRERGRFVFTEQSLIRAVFSDYFSCTLRTFLDRPRLIFPCRPVRQCSVVFESELQFGVVLFVHRL